MDEFLLKHPPKADGERENHARKCVGIYKDSIEKVFMHFLEECGEMAGAARKKEAHLDYEIADVFISLLHICNHFGIDLEKAFREKEEINKKRIWK